MKTSEPTRPTSNHPGHAPTFLTLTERLIVVTNSDGVACLKSGDLKGAARHFREARGRLRRARETVSYGTILAVAINSCEVAMRREAHQTHSLCSALYRQCKRLRERYIYALLQRNSDPTLVILEWQSFDRMLAMADSRLSFMGQEAGISVTVVGELLLRLARPTYSAIAFEGCAVCPSAAGAMSPHDEMIDMDRRLAAVRDEMTKAKKAVSKRMPKGHQQRCA